MKEKYTMREKKKILLKELLDPDNYKLNVMRVAENTGFSYKTILYHYDKAMEEGRIKIKEIRYLSDMELLEEEKCAAVKKEKTA